MTAPAVSWPARPGLRGGAPRRAPRAALVSSQAYDAADVMGAEIGAWRPFREHPDSEAGWARDLLTARARDLARNNGYAAGAAAREVDAVVGASFRPAAKPDWRALGIDRAEAARVAGEMEAAWRLWADDPRRTACAQRASGWGGLAALAYRSYLLDGDAIGVLHWREDAPGPFATALRVVDPDLLANPQDAMDRADLRGGVELDAHGAAVAYHFRREHRAAVWGAAQAWVWDRIDRETPWGRPVVVHHFDRARADQTRGVSRFTPIIDALKMTDKHARTEVQAAVLGALLGLFVQSQMDPDSVNELLSTGSEAAVGNLVGYAAARDAMHDQRGITFGGVRIPVLPPGDTIQTVSATRPAGQFADFEAACLRRIAAGLGTSYEQLALDWSKVNYSSARAALVEIWRGWTANRRRFADGFCAPVWLAVMEEAVDLGLVRLPAGAPDFHAAPGAWCRAKWIGPGRGWVDPVKEVEGAVLRVSAGLSTMEDEAAELSGADYEETLAQLADEIASMPPGVAHPAQTAFAELSAAANGPAAGVQP
jgi:lambda family phage portal protein